MKSSIYRKAVATGVAIATLLPVMAFAQSVGAPMQMPTLYSSTGTVVNGPGAGSLPAGNYYLTPGGQQVYYFGNGTYYNTTTGEYGGNIGNPTGAAGTFTPVYYSNNVGQNTGGTVDTTMTPGVPNTGAGGEALRAWITLAVAGSVMVGGVMLIAWGRRNALS